MPGKSKFQISRSLDERIKRIISGSSENDPEYAHVSSAYILGFNYGNVTNCVGLTTNYQLHHAVFPVVGLAFFKTSPTDDDIKTNLKSIKEFSSSPNGLGSFKSDKNEHLFLIYSVDKETNEVDKRIFNFTKGSFVRRKRLRLSVLNDPFTPRQIYNGSDDIFNLDDVDSLASAEDDHIDHLIFFIHGVGGVCDARFRSCVEVVADFKKMANNLLELHSDPSSGASTPTNHHLAKHLKKGFFRKHSQESSASRSSDIETSRSSPTKPRAKRVECLPVSWHSMTRRQTGINDQLNLIALSSVPKLRGFIDKVVLDALLYSSGPCYTQTIINNVGNEINRLYTLFMEKHPNFTGSVSLAGHSLGSVIIFDLLAHQIPPEMQPPPSTNFMDATTTATDDSNSSARNTNQNNNNNNNNNNYNTETHSNTRRRCGNVSHHHHNATSQSDDRYCSDYTSLEDLLKDMDLVEYSELFHKEHIDLNSLLLLTDLDLKELRLPLGARRKLGTYINFKRVSCFTVSSGLHPVYSNHAQTAHKQQTSIGTSGNIEYNHNLSSGTADQQQLIINPMSNMNTGQFLVEYPQLKFKPRCFFAFGSPTPMFLNIRGIQNLSSEYKLPTCDRMLNIYHPYDPLAYRMEPLIDPRFKNVEPVLVPHHRGGKRIHVQLREGFAKVGHDIKHRLLGSLRNTWSSFTRVNPPDDVSPETSHSNSMDELTTSDSELKNQNNKEKKKSVISTTSSVDVEIRSMNSRSSTDMGCISSEPSNRDTQLTSNNSATSSIDKSNNQSNEQQQQQQRRLLKRQQELPQTKSELHTTVSSDRSSSTLEFHDPLVQMTTESEPSDPDAIVIDRLKSIGLNQEPREAPKRPKLDDDERQDRPDGNTDDQGNQGAQDSGPDVGFDTTKVGRLNAGRRIDYVLQEKPIELFNEYIFVATSHANYWQQEDSALLVLKEIFQVDDGGASSLADEN